MVVEFQVHSVVNLVVPECDVVLEDGVPLFEDDLVPLGARLRRDQLLQVTHSVVLVALDPNLFGKKDTLHRSVSMAAEGGTPLAKSARISVSGEISDRGLVGQPT